MMLLSGGQEIGHGEGFSKRFLYRDIISSLFLTGKGTLSLMSSLKRMGFRETILKERSVGLGCDQQEALAISLNGWSKKKQILCIGRNCSFSYSESKMHETQRTYLRNFSKVLFKRYLLKCEGVHWRVWMRRITGKSEAEKGGRAISKGWDFLYPGSHLRRAQQESLGRICKLHIPRNYQF